MTKERRFKREQNRINTYLNKLIAEYLKAKNLNVVALEDKLFFLPPIEEKIKYLNLIWTKFVKNYTGDKKEAAPKPMAFLDWVKEDRYKHSRDTWIRFAKTRMEEYYGLENIDTVLLSPEFDTGIGAEELAIKTVCEISPFA